MSSSFGNDRALLSPSGGFAGPDTFFRGVATPSVVRQGKEDGDGDHPVAATFADTSLRLAVLAAFGGVDGPATAAWMDTVTRLAAQNAGIVSLSGIEHMPRLRILDLSDNDIVDVAPLETLDSLIFLDLTANRVAIVTPLARLRPLEFLLLAGNRIKDISPILELPNLSSLELTGNPLTEEQLERIGPLKERGVQVIFEREHVPRPPIEYPNFGAMTFAFRGYSAIGHKPNIWLGFTDGTPPRPVIEENASLEGHFHRNVRVGEVEIVGYPYRVRWQPR